MMIKINYLKRICHFLGLGIMIFWGTYSAEAQQKSFTLQSPDEDIAVTVEITDQISYSIQFSNKQILASSVLSLTVENHGVLGRNPVLEDTERRSVDNVLHPVVQVQSASINNKFNELTLSFQQGYKVVFRAYNDGIAYRFVTSLDDEEIKVTTEQIQYDFAGDYQIYFPEEESFFTHQERLYKYLKLSEISADRFSSIPALVTIEDGPLMLISEASLRDYPGFYLKGTGSSKLTAIFPNVATDEKLKGDRNLVVTERADYIAETSGSRSFPWRLLVITEDAGGLIENQLVYQLGIPLQLEETDWINPGKVSWDWWNARNIYDVDFQAGINNKTYKYYIDFAAKIGLDYIILDEGWSNTEDLTDLSANIDIEELVAYGKKKDVGIILWVVWKTLEDQWEVAFEKFDEWGIKGIKVDFMQRDDQWMVNWYWDVAKEAAEHHLLVDFHGSYKPSGIRRAYPNVITREGVKGLENNKWSDAITPEHDLIIPFIRMAVGPMDYTPGAMINAQPERFRAIGARPMSQGTRVHQLAMYVVYESPLQMLADSPSHYLEQKDPLLNYLGNVPATWDETRVFKGEVGDYIVLARRSGDRWYVGAMTDENARHFEIDLSFLNEGNYTAKIFSDGINADRYAEDYEFNTKEVTTNSTITVDMKPGGGWVGVFIPKE